MHHRCVLALGPALGPGQKEREALRAVEAESGRGREGQDLHHEWRGNGGVTGGGALHMAGEAMGPFGRENGP